MTHAVLFDFHNTLATCDSWLELEITTLPALVLERLSARRTLPGLPEDYREEAVRLFREVRQRARESGIEISAVEGAREVLEVMGYHVDGSLLEPVVAELEYACLADLRVVRGAEDALVQLRWQGHRLAVVSSAGYPPFVERALEQLKLRRYFDEVLTSASEGIYKSDPRIFTRAVERLGCRPGDSVHIGDHAAYDVQAAQRAGLKAIWYFEEAERTARLHNADWPRLMQLGSLADAVVFDLGAIPEVVGRLWRTSG